MNDKKFAIIACVNDESMWRECERHLDKLVIPDGYSLERIKISDAKSITVAYNEAIRKSDAKYKIYLHQDTFILNENILSGLLGLFSNPVIGMVGMQGGTRIPKSGVWFHDGLHSFGTIMRIGVTEGVLKKLIPKRWNPRKVKKFSYMPFRGAYLPVACIDGLFMATQYDIPWREDLFGGFTYYEGPHCLEFIKQGYQVVIPQQKKPWCLHVGANRTPEEDAKYHQEFRAVMDVFRREYGWSLNKSYHQIRQFLHNQPDTNTNHQ